MFRRILAGSLVMLGVQSQAFANDNLTIQLPLLGYSSDSSETKPDGGATTKETSTGLLTSDLSGGYFQFTLSSLQVYLYPFNAAAPRKVSVGYTLGPIEAGVNLGLANTKQDKAKTESNSTLVGLYGVYSASLGSGLVLEAGLSLDSISSNTKEVAAAAAGAPAAAAPTFTKTNNSGMDIGLSVNAIKSLSKRLSYVGGFSYNMKSNEEKESKVKTSNGVLALNLATFRYSFN